MKKVNTSAILLLIFLLVFSIGSKPKIEQTKWEYAYYVGDSLDGYLLYGWQEPGKKAVAKDIAMDIATKLNIKHGLENSNETGLETSMWPYNLFQYAGEQGWELVFKETKSDGIGFTYWFKRPKRG